MAIELDPNNDSKIDVGFLPTVDFAQTADPTAPVYGQIWWNGTTNQLCVAGTAGIYRFTHDTITAWDTTPAAFSFTDVVDAQLGQDYVSNSVTIGGMNWEADITVTGSTGAKYSLNNGTPTAAAGKCQPGDVVRAYVPSSASYATATTATITIGGVSDTYTVTTVADNSATDVFIGWANTAGVPDSDPTSSTSSQVVTLLQAWTATADGTLETLNVYTGAYTDTAIRTLRLVVYSLSDTTLTLKAQVVVSGQAQNDWTDAKTLVAESGQSLDYLEGDVLYYGAMLNMYPTFTGSLGRETTGGSGARRSTSITSNTAAPATIDITTLTNYSTWKVAGILGVVQ